MSDCVGAVVAARQIRSAFREQPMSSCRASSMLHTTNHLGVAAAQQSVHNRAAKLYTSTHRRVVRSSSSPSMRVAARTGCISLDALVRIASCRCHHALPANPLITCHMQEKCQCKGLVTTHWFICRLHIRCVRTWHVHASVVELRRGTLSGRASNMHIQAHRYCASAAPLATSVRCVNISQQTYT